MNSAQILDLQREYYLTDATKDVDFRKKQLGSLKDVLKKNEQQLFAAIQEDFSKSSFETYMTELAPVYHEINTAIKRVGKWANRKRVKTNIANWPGRSYIIPEPLGNCLVIGAWNYPYNLSLAPVVAAIAAGNTVILKPSEIPKMSSAALATLINDSFPARYFHVVEGGIPETTELLELDFDKIFFTGSTRVGKIVYQAAAKKLIPVTLELGGKSPAFVLNDCKVDIAAKRLVWAKYLNAGQTCIAPDYVMIETAIKKQFVEALTNEIKQFYKNEIGQNYVQIIDDRNFQRLLALMDKDKICYGGYTDANQRFIGPTLLDGVDFGDPVMESEIFGPILPMIEVEDLEQTVDRVKRLPKPLACYVFSNDRKKIDNILKQISFGGGTINDAIMHIANPHLPFGGVGSSGIGSYHGEAGFRVFSHYKGILHRAAWGELKLKYAPYNDKKKRWIKWLVESS